MDISVFLISAATDICSFSQAYVMLAHAFWTPLGRRDPAIYNNNFDVKQFLTDILIGKNPIDFSDNVIKLDRSRFCKLWITDGFIIEEIAPIRQPRFDGKEQRRLVEDCGKLIAYKK